MIHCPHFDSQMSPNSISEHLFFNIVLGGMPLDPPSISMLSMLIALRTITLNLSLNKMAPLLLYAPGPLTSLGGPVSKLYIGTYYEGSLCNKIHAKTLNLLILTDS